MVSVICWKELAKIVICFLCWSYISTDSASKLVKNAKLNGKFFFCKTGFVEKKFLSVKVEIFYVRFMT
jgi:hypothetical protein